MNIHSLISSSIKKTGELYEVRLPNFYGFVEWVLYMHEGITIDYCSGVFGTKLDMSEWSDPLEAVFLMSQIYGLLVVRVVHADRPSEDTLLVAKAVKIVSFRIRSATYFGILYYDELWDLRLLTDFLDTEMIRSSFENGLWCISNTLTGTNLYQFSFPRDISSEKEWAFVQWAKTYSFYVLEDALFPNKEEKLKIDHFIENTIAHGGTDSPITLEKIGESLTKVTLFQKSAWDPNNPLNDLKKFIGILGNHLIITEEDDILPEYLSLDEIEDIDRDEIESFTTSEEIEFFDPKWHNLRVTLLKFGYLVYSIEKHILLTKESLQDIRAVASPHLEYQAHRSKLTLEWLETIKRHYHVTLESLLKSIKHSQNLI